MKKKYIAPQIAFAHLASQNVICTSGGGEPGNISDTPSDIQLAPGRGAVDFDPVFAGINPGRMSN